MNANEIKKAIEVLRTCQYCWADQVPNDDEKVSDYKAIEQTIRCLEEYKDSLRKNLNNLKR